MNITPRVTVAIPPHKVLRVYEKWSKFRDTSYPNKSTYRTILIKEEAFELNDPFLSDDFRLLFDIFKYCLIYLWY